MKRSDIRILVLDDEGILGKAFSDALVRAGYQAKAVTSADEARQQLRITSYQVLLTDVLLPKVNGVDLIHELRATRLCPERVILTSGIFKDKSFIRDALSSTGALAYLQKPFNIQDLIQVVQDAFNDQLDPDRDGLELLKETASASNQEIQNALTRVETAVGFELPYIYTLIFRAGLSGQLTLVGSDKSTSSVSFSKGRVVEVNVQDKKSYFGVLIVEKGFCSFEDVQQILGVPGDKPMGQRLVDAQALSPHAINIVLKEQMAIRLSKTIQPISYEIKFTPIEIPSQEIFIDELSWWELVADWVHAKSPMHWLQNRYTTWMDFPIQLIMSEHDRESLLKLAMIFRHRPLLEQLKNSPSLSSLLEANKDQSDDVFRFIHFLLISRLIVFGKKEARADDENTMQKRLSQIAGAQLHQNYFEILGVHQKSSKKDISRAYMEMAKAIHPDKISPKSPQTLKDLAQKVFARITQAYDTLSDDVKREEYRKTLEKGAAEEILQAEALFEEGRGLLIQGRYRQALEKFATVRAMKNHRPDLVIFLAWVRLKIGPPKEKPQRFFEEMVKLLNEVPPEDRHSANFMFVKGLYYKNTGDRDKALVNFKNALTLDPSLRDAKREALSMKGVSSGKTRSFTDELTQAVGALFGKSKKRRSG